MRLICFLSVIGRVFGHENLSLHILSIFNSTDRGLCADVWAGGW